MTRRLWNAVRGPGPRFAPGSLVALGVVMGAIGLAGTQATLHATSTDEFCLSCHELAENVGKEYEGTIHHTNRAGFKVTCAACHVPKPIVPKLWRKARAVSEIYHHLLGTIDTPEKFDAHRMEMAMRVWQDMNANDSRECRDCHRMTEQAIALQHDKARKYHAGALAKGKTCIDCHKGNAHKLPPGVEADEQLQGVDF